MLCCIECIGFKLSVKTRSADSFASFKRRLKSKLFASTYATQDGSALSQCSRFRVLHDQWCYINLAVVAVVAVVRKTTDFHGQWNLELSHGICYASYDDLTIKNRPETTNAK